MRSFPGEIAANANAPHSRRRYAFGMEWKLRSLGALGLGAGLALVPFSVSADTLDQPFLVTTTTQTAGGTVAYRDVLIVRSDATIAGAPAVVQRDSVCMAIVQRVLAAGSPAKPYTIGVALDDDHAVQVPMRASVTQPGSGARLVEATGNAAGNLVNAANDHVTIGVHVDARVLAQDGRLEAATFRELTYLNTPMQTVEVSGCDMQRLPLAPPASDEPQSSDDAPPTPA
jgi:hypothetical protein